MLLSAVEKLNRRPRITASLSRLTQKAPLFAVWPPVHLQAMDGCPTNSGDAHDAQVILREGEVIPPSIAAAGVE
jgi:hypothetical protein